MNVDQLHSLVQAIVEEATQLKDLHTAEKKAKVNYACIFSQNQAQYNELLEVTRRIGSVKKETPTGPIFEINALQTASGKLRLLKIRMPDKTRTEKGDADFTITDYPAFKQASLSKPGFKLIQRPEMEMIELMDDAFNVRAYFSNPTQEQLLGLA